MLTPGEFGGHAYLFDAAAGLLHGLRGGLAVGKRIQGLSARLKSNGAESAGHGDQDVGGGSDRLSVERLKRGCQRLPCPFEIGDHLLEKLPRGIRTDRLAQRFEDRRIDRRLAGFGGRHRSGRRTSPHRAAYVRRQGAAEGGDARNGF